MFKKLFIFIGCIALLFSVAKVSHAAQVTGYAWSGNIGWINMSGVTINDQTGAFSGYAWSPNIGWINFGLTGVTMAGGTNPGIHAVTGFARACTPATTGPGSGQFCNDTGNSTGYGSPTSDTNTNGWGGWISMSGSNPTYGVSININSSGLGTFSGYAWGDDVIGWINFATAAPITAQFPTSTIGCMDPMATNYNPNATTPGMCAYDILGCTNPIATNYNPQATVDDGSCILPQNSSTVLLGNGLPNAVTVCEDKFNFSLTWQSQNVSSCVVGSGNTGPWPPTYSSTVGSNVTPTTVLSGPYYTVNPGVYTYAMSCVPTATSALILTVLPKTDPMCAPPITGCMDPNATNYNPLATIANNALCTYPNNVCPASALNAGQAPPCQYPQGPGGRPIYIEN